MAVLTTPLKSSWLVSASYDTATHTLDVETRSGRSYTHEGVPQTVYDRLVSSSSPGRTYNNEIKRLY